MWISARRAPSGRNQKRLLNRARSCGLCGKGLGGDRALYDTQSGWSSLDRDLIAAHPACAGRLTEENQARLLRETERLGAMSARISAGRMIAATMPVSRSLITVAFAPPSVRPAMPWEVR